MREGTLRDSKGFDEKVTSIKIRVEFEHRFWRTIDFLHCTRGLLVPEVRKKKRY